MSTTIPTDITVTVNSPNTLACSFGIDIKEISGGNVIVAFGDQQMSLYAGSTLTIQFSLDRKHVAGLFGDKMIEEFEKFIAEAKGTRRGWFGIGNKP